jgi:hypothetical protein
MEGAITMYTYNHNPVIYQADPSHTHVVKHMKDHIHSIGKQYLGHKVRVQTLDGNVLDGTIIKIEGTHLYLHIHTHDHRAFYNPAAATILPLVLYELLVITLLS